MRRGEPPPAAKLARGSQRFEIDRVWLWRGCLALVVVGFVVVLAKASMMLVGGGNQRMERHEQASERPAVTKPVSQAISPPTR